MPPVGSSRCGGPSFLFSHKERWNFRRLAPGRLLKLPCGRSPQRLHNLLWRHAVRPHASLSLPSSPRAATVRLNLLPASRHRVIKVELVHQDHRLATDGMIPTL